MAEFFTVIKNGKTKQVREGAQLKAAREDGWKPVGDKRVDTEFGERTETAEEAIRQLETGEARNLVSSDTIRQRAGAEWQKERYSDQGVQALGEGALGSVPILGPHVVRELAEITEGDAGSVQARKEENPFESTVGNVTGTVLQAVAPFGLAGKAGKIAGMTPGGLMSRGATAAGEGVFKATGSKVGQYAVEGAIDATAWGVGQRYADGVIADTPVNIEHIIGGIPSDILFGGATGGVLGALGSAAKRAGDKIVKKGAIEAEQAAAKAEFSSGRRVTDEAVINAQHKYDSLVLSHGADSAAAKAQLAVANKLKKESRSAAKAYAKGISAEERQVGQEIGKFADDLTSDIVTSSKHATGSIEMAGEEAVLSARGELARWGKKEFMALDPEFKLIVAERVGKSLEDLKMIDYRDFVARQAGLVNQSANRIKKLSGGKKFLDLDVDDFNKFTEEFAFLKRVQNDYAGMLRPLNANVGDMMVTPLNLSKLDAIAEKFPTFSKNKFFDEAGELTSFGIEAEKIGLNLDDLTDPASEALARVWLTSKMTKAGDELAATAGLSAAEAAKLEADKITQQALGSKDALAQAKQDLINKKQAKGLFNTENRELAEQLKIQAKAAAEAEVKKPGFFGGLAGTLAGRHLGGAIKLVTAGPEAISKGIAAFVKFGGKPMRGTVPAASTILGKLKFDKDLGEKPAKGRKENFMRISRELDSVASNPEKAKQRIHESLKEMKTLKPGMADALTNKAYERMMFLHGITPRSPNVNVFGPDRWGVSQTEIDKFARIAAAAENPYSILDDLNTGKLTQEAVDTVRQLYPEIYHSIQMEIVNNVDQIKSSVGYKGRLQLGVLFQVPTDDVLQPAFVKMMQDNYMIRAQEQEQATGGGGQYSTPGNNQKAIASQATTSQRLEAAK